MEGAELFPTANIVVVECVVKYIIVISVYNKYLYTTSIQLGPENLGVWNLNHKFIFALWVIMYAVEVQH